MTAHDAPTPDPTEGGMAPEAAVETDGVDRASPADGRLPSSRLGRLHPRLAPAEARRRLEAYADVPLTELRSRSAVEDPLTSFAAVGAARLRAAEARALQSELRDAAESSGWPDPPSDSSSTVFDRAATRILLENGRLFPAEASAPEIWSFHALVLAPDAAFWRFRERRGRGVNPERLLGSDLTRHVFGRLWWRGYMLCAQPDGSLDLDNLELLQVFGEADFDQIQARRRAFGASPTVFQTIARLWKSLDAEERLIESAFPRRELLRDMLIRLLRLGAFQRFDLLPSQELSSEVLRAFEESLVGLSEVSSLGPRRG